MSDRRQEWFNQIVRGFHAQNWQPSYDKEQGACQYRGPDGVKCAVGHVISDEAAAILDPKAIGLGNLKYQDTLDDEAVYTLDDLGLGKITEEEYRFLSNIQSSHDECALFSAQWHLLRQAMESFGRFHNLTWPEDVPR